MSAGMSIAHQLSKYSSLGLTGGTIVNRKLLIGAFVIALASFFVGCSSSDQANANQTITTTGPDNSEIVTTTDSTGTRTETRTFRDNGRVSRVVVTTRDGRRTVRVYSKTGEERELTEEVGDALALTGDKLADAAGWVAEKTTAGVNEVGDKAEDVGDKAKTVGREVGDKAEDVGDKATSTAKTVGSKTVSGAKKTGKTIKKVVTP
jgi:major membrane immunogen (membrane-anchored lipoprotein)